MARNQRADTHDAHGRRGPRRGSWSRGGGGGPRVIRGRSGIYLGNYCEYLGNYCEYLGNYCEYLGNYCEYLGNYCEYLGNYCEYLGMVR
jgi:hypothetical protein